MLTPLLTDIVDLVQVKDLIKYQLIVTLTGQNWNEAKLSRVYIIVGITQTKFHLFNVAKSAMGRQLFCMQLPETTPLFILSMYGVHELKLFTKLKQSLNSVVMLLL